MALPSGRQRNTETPFEKLLKNNDLGIIENPLRRIDEDDLISDIKSFHEETEGLKDVVSLDVLKRGGLLARDEEGFRAEGDISEPEEAALDREKTSTLWQETKELNVILLTCFVASVVQGWTQGAIVGANQLWPNDLHLDTGLTDATKHIGNSRDLWRFSATNAIVYFSASTLGAFICDPLTEIVMGRRGALFVSALFTFAASVGEAYCQSWRSLFATRVILGIGMGAKTSVVPVYESEVSPARLRGISQIPIFSGPVTDNDRSISCLLADRDCSGSVLLSHRTSDRAPQLALSDLKFLHPLVGPSIPSFHGLGIATLAYQEGKICQGLRCPAQAPR